MKTFLALAALLTLSGCLATPYQSSGMSGGVTASRIAADRFIIRSAGNGFTSLQQTRDFAVLRAAEATLAAGYTHFTVTGGASGMQTEKLNPPVMTTTSGTIHTTGGLSTVNAQSITQPLGPSQVSKPTAEIAIHCHRQPGAPAIDAALAARQIRTRYGLPVY